MCLAIPMRIVEVRGETALVESSGASREVSLALVPGARTGDHVLVHAGFAIRVVDEKEAEETLALIREIVAFDPEEP